MYCPRCGQQQVSDELRFCSRCGCNLDGVKAFIAEDQSVPDTSLSVRRRTVNLGVISMFTTVILLSLGSLIAFGVMVGGNLGMAGGFLALVAAFLANIILSSPIIRSVSALLSWEEPPDGKSAPRVKEMAFGALLMFLGTILAGCIINFVPRPIEGVAFLFTLMTVFAVLLVSSHSLMKVVRKLITDDESKTRKLTRPSAEVQLAGGEAEDPALVTTRIPARLFSSRGTATAEIVPPPSVTEPTTKLLESD
jgi:hypothetical protein